jgi:exonuclease VII large subunit
MQSSFAAVDGMWKRLEAVSPQAVLSRGFGIVYVQGRSVKSVSEVSVGNAFDVRLADGVVSGLIEATREVKEDG